MGDQAGDVVQGRYRLDKVLGEGTYGKVFRAHDSKTDTSVAIKIMSMTTKSDEYRRELAAYASLSQQPGCHQYIVCLYDHFIIEDKAYEVLELMDGDTQGKLRPKTPADQLAFIRDVLVGMDFIHERGYAHQDLKPPNILVRGSSYKVGDLGAVCSNAAKSTVGRCEVFGSLLPPEYDPKKMHQPESTKSAQMADVWALGATFYYAITGSWPYEFAKVYQIDQPNVAVLNAGTSFGLVSTQFVNDMVNSMLRVNPSERPTVRQLLGSLNAELVGCTQDDGHRLNRSSLSLALTNLNIAHNPKAPLADLCNLLKKALKAPSPTKKKVEPITPCNLRNQDLPEGAFRYIANLFQVTGSRKEVCRQINRMVTDQGLIDRRRIAVVVYEGLIEASKLKYAKQMKEMEQLEHQILDIIGLVAPVDGIDRQYLLDQYNNALAYTRHIPTTPDEATAVELSKIFVRKYQALTETPQWAMLPKHAPKVQSREVEMIM